jgi:hypothetical protein
VTKITSWVEPGRCDENRCVEINGGGAFYFLGFRSNAYIQTELVALIDVQDHLGARRG